MSDHGTRVALAFCASLLCSSLVTASEIHCTPSVAETFCNLRTETVQLTQNDIDTMSSQTTSAAWVIGGSTTISLPAASTWTPGGALFNAEPTIWVIGDATLEIVGDGGSEVGINADIYLCDNATFRVKDSTFRSLQQADFTNWIWAAGNSTIEYENAEIAAAENGFTANLYQAMRASSTLSNTLAGPAVFDSSGGGITLEVLDDAQASVADSSFLVEFFTAGDADLNVSTSSFFSVSMTNCPTESLTLSDIPVACEIGSNCFAPGHPLTDFVHASAPTLNIDDGKMFGWTVETYPGSTTSLSNVPNDANMQMLVAGEMNPLSLTLAPNTPPVGITDRTINLTSAQVPFWSVSATGASEVDLNQGTQLLNLFSTDTSEIRAEGITIDADLEIFGSSFVRLDDSSVAASVTNASQLAAIETSLGASLAVQGETWLADSTYPAGPTFSSSGMLYTVALTAPDNGAIFTDEMIEVRGTVQAFDESGIASPFPEAVLELVDVGNMVTTPLATITSEGTDAVLETVDASGLELGDYALRLRFSNTEEAISIRMFTIELTPLVKDGFESE